MNDISAISLPFNTVVLIKSSTNWYDSTLFSGMVGVVIGFLMNKIFDNIKERRELDRYEYTLLSKTKELIKENPINDANIDFFVNQLYPDLRFVKLGSSKIITSTLLKAKQGDDYSIEIEAIVARIRILKQNGLISKFQINISNIKDKIRRTLQRCRLLD